MLPFNAEVKYPIIPNHRIDKVVNKTDAGTYGRTVLPADLYVDKLRFRVHADEIETMVQYLEDNLLAPVVLNTPGIYPFGQNFTESNVNIRSYGNLSRELPVHYNIDVTFEFVSGIA